MLYENDISMMKKKESRSFTHVVPWESENVRDQIIVKIEERLTN